MSTHQKYKQEDREILYLPIDQHRKQLTVNLRNEQGDLLLKRQVGHRAGWPILAWIKTLPGADSRFYALLGVAEELLQAR